MLHTAHTEHIIHTSRRQRGLGAPGQPLVCKQKRFLTKHPPHSEMPHLTGPDIEWWAVVTWSHINTYKKTLVHFMTWQLWDSFSKFQWPSLGLAVKWHRPVCVLAGSIRLPGRWQQRDSDCWDTVSRGGGIVTGQSLSHTRWLWFHSFFQFLSFVQGSRQTMTCSSVRITTVMLLEMVKHLMCTQQLISAAVVNLLFFDPKLQGR